MIHEWEAEVIHALGFHSWADKQSYRYNPSRSVGESPELWYLKAQVQQVPENGDDATPTGLLAAPERQGTPLSGLPSPAHSPYPPTGMAPTLPAPPHSIISPDPTGYQDPVR